MSEDADLASGVIEKAEKAAERRRILIAIGLFILTVGSTTLVGGGDNIMNGVAYSATVMSILLAHEMGHYLVARHHGVPRSPPYFIPFPFGVLGTFGAVISMRTDQATRNQLMDIGAAGPIMGFLVAVPAMVLGVTLSPLVKLDASANGMFLGDSILSYGITKLFGPEIPEGYDLLAHPVLMAAWAGFLVTALNLLPIGQLDGGHVLHAWAPVRSSIWYRRFFRVMIALSVIGLVVQAPEIVHEIAKDPAAPSIVPAWLLEATQPLHRWFTPGFILIVLLARLTGKNHPPVRDVDVPLTPLRRIVGVACLVIFVLTFMPNPIWGGTP